MINLSLPFSEKSTLHRGFDLITQGGLFMVQPYWVGIRAKAYMIICVIVNSALMSVLIRNKGICGTAARANFLINCITLRGTYDTQITL